MNYYDLMRQYVGRAYGGDGSGRYRAILERIAEKAIVDVGNLGDSFVRVPMLGYFPVAASQSGGALDDLALWRTDPSAYWSIVDRMMDHLDTNGVRLVPVFLSSRTQLPAMNNETQRDLVVDPDSKSFRMLEEYTREFVERYRDRSTIYFYEITNELNLAADVGAESYCAQRFGEAALCEHMASFSSAELIAFSTRYASYIRTLDPTRFISSGFSIPRPSAERLRRQPAWNPGGADWALDGKAEFQRNLIDIHQGIDIISVHFYNVRPPGGASNRRSNMRFGITTEDDAGLLDVVKAAADRAGKRLFVGEFGDWDPFFKDDPSAPFSHAVLEKIVALGIDYAAVWAWEFYSGFRSTHDQPATYDNVEQGYTDALIGTIQDTNEALGNRVNRPAADETVPPQVIIAWPLPGSAIVTSEGEVHVRASDNDYSAGLDRVVLRIDDVVIASLSSPPYVFRFDTVLAIEGSHIISAQAFDRNGNWAEDRIQLIDGKVAN